MTDHNDMKHLIVRDLLTGLMAQEHDLGDDGSHLIELLQAAGYESPNELYADLWSKEPEHNNSKRHH